MKDYVLLSMLFSHTHRPVQLTQYDHLYTTLIIFGFVFSLALWIHSFIISWCTRRQGVPLIWIVDWINHNVQWIENISINGCLVGGQIVQGKQGSESLKKLAFMITQVCVVVPCSFVLYSEGREWLIWRLSFSFPIQWFIFYLN